MPLFNLLKSKKAHKFISPEDMAFYLNEIHSKIHKLPEEMTDKEKDHIVSIYNVMYTSLHVIPVQRQDTHKIFFGIYTFVFSLLGYSIFSKYNEWLTLDAYYRIVILALIDFFFISIAYTWEKMLLAYVNFNYILIMITQSLEKYLPVHVLESLFFISKKMNITTNLAEEMSLLPKLLAILAVATSIVAFFA